MTISPFIQDMTEDEYVAAFCDSTGELLHHGFNAIDTKVALRERHRFHSQPFEEVVKEYRQKALKDINDPEQLKAATNAVNEVIACIMYELTAPPCNTRWVLQEYACRMEGTELIEETRPVQLSTKDFWSEVNN